ncbi:MAG: AAA family ATPase [Nanoarchaeota archaeon]|nr:AAA family ATPase [Nanoarchaeota archaeon]
MFIKSLELRNIRSYQHQTIEFKEGTTLLSGDIGSGKTTLLLAIEFALFGLLRGKTQPSELLRHDCKEGSISLHLELAGHDVRITRGLKRGSGAIAQTTGTLLVDGTEESYVATELKARILELMGYPESLLSKSTNLFRYTVYTPQEQVKQILHETVDERKDIIRNIFGIDKYKRVVENTTPYVADLRERIARNKGQTDDVKILEEQLASQEKELIHLIEQKKPVQESYEQAKEKTLVTKKVLEEKRKEQDAQKREQLKQELTKQRLLSEQNIIKMLEEQRITLEKRLGEDSLKEVIFEKEKKQQVQDVLVQLSTKRSLLQKKYGELDARRRQSQELQQQILDLTTCPTCQQDVGSDHKTHIRTQQEQIILAVEKKRAEYDLLAEKITEKEEHLQKRLKELDGEERQYLLFLERKKQQEQDRKSLLHLKEQIVQKKESLMELEKEQHQEQKKPLDTRLEEDAYEKARVQEQQLALTLREQTTKEQGAQQLIAQLKRTIEEKKQIAIQIAKLTSLRTWVQELFVPLVKTIEKRVLLQIYQEFNNHFTQWFSQLMDDESLSVRLDEDFTPLVEQHGYDTNVNNLSGGEKTSLALAYRLALNKVLNDYFSSLHTKGLLILDEPTDGFSSQQLDKLRDVLDQIGVKQVIIVSHEQKLESVAEHLIHVFKEHQVSRIVHS